MVVAKHLFVFDLRVVEGVDHPKRAEGVHHLKMAEGVHHLKMAEGVDHPKMAEGVGHSIVPGSTDVLAKVDIQV